MSPVSMLDVPVLVMAHELLSPVVVDPVPVVEEMLSALLVKAHIMIILTSRIPIVFLFFIGKY